MAKKTKYALIKLFFQRDDIFTPGGGQKVTLAEMKKLSVKEATELGKLAAVELGVELEEL